jgi:ribosome-associated translation inhibitor RaiA
MIIQFNADNILNIHEGFEKQVEDRIAKEFIRFNEPITRIDIYITEEKEFRAGLINFKCLIGAHLKAVQSVVVSDVTNTLEQSVNGAVEKLKTALDSINSRSKGPELYLMAI